MARTVNITGMLSTLFFGLIFLQLAPQLLKSIKEQYSAMLKPRAKVAKVCIDGEIKKTESYIKHLKQYFKDKEIKAVLLAIDSPGGYAGSSQVLFEEIKALKKMYPKPVVALSVDMCVSGAYYVACSADYIVTSAAATVGSIGAFTAFFNLYDLMEQYKIRYAMSKSGTYKSAGSMYMPISDEERAMLQGVVDSVAEQFTYDVATSRKLLLSESDIWGNGKLFTGLQARDLGLVDAVGSEYTAVKKIEELALIDKEIEWVTPPHPTAWEKIMSGDAGIAQAVSTAVIDCLRNEDRKPKISL